MKRKIRQDKDLPENQIVYRKYANTWNNKLGPPHLQETVRSAEGYKLKVEKNTIYKIIFKRPQLSSNFL